MAEELTLTTPVVTPAKTTTGYYVGRLLMDRDQQLFLMIVRGTNGESRGAERRGVEAMTLMRALNKANGTIKSLDRRALEWYLTQPEGADLQGAVTGAPD
jgi:hypothetical protein